MNLNLFHKCLKSDKMIQIFLMSKGFEDVSFKNLLNYYYQAYKGIFLTSVTLQSYNIAKIII